MSVDQSRDGGVPFGTPASPNISDAVFGTSASLATVMRAVHVRLGKNAAKQLALITGQDAKTAQRQLAQGREPNGPAVYAMVRHPIVGPAFIIQATRNLPKAEHQQFWIGMAVAVGDALRDKDERL